MDDYNFWADLLASYRASPDAIKALWLLVPLAPALGFSALGIAVALRLTESRTRASDRAAPGEEARAEISLHTAVSDAPLIEIEADRQPVSRRLPSR